MRFAANGALPQGRSLHRAASTEAADAQTVFGLGIAPASAHVALQHSGLQFDLRLGIGGGTGLLLQVAELGLAFGDV